MKGLGGSTLAKVLVSDTGQGSFYPGLRYGLLPLEIVPMRIKARVGQGVGAGGSVSPVGIQELACGGQAFIATSLFDPSMSALPIIPKQNSVSVGLFTH